jgi:hypothetical protein
VADFAMEEQVSWFPAVRAHNRCASTERKKSRKIENSGGPERRAERAETRLAHCWERAIPWRSCSVARQDAPLRRRLVRLQWRAPAQTSAPLEILTRHIAHRCIADARLNVSVGCQAVAVEKKERSGDQRLGGAPSTIIRGSYYTTTAACPSTTRPFLKIQRTMQERQFQLLRLESPKSPQELQCWPDPVSKPPLPLYGNPC